MKAVILAAGKGTRMRELTHELPKPMLPVEGRPILEHILEGLLAAGIREVCIITGWKAEVIEGHMNEHVAEEKHTGKRKIAADELLEVLKTYLR